MNEGSLIHGTNTLAYRVSSYFQKNEDQNYIVYSIGIHELLTILYENPRDNSGDDDVIPANVPFYYKYGYLSPRYYQDYLTHFNTVDQDALRIFSQAFLKENLQLQTPFKSLLLEHFLSGLDTVDFDNQEGTLNSLNSWIEDNTSGVLKTVHSLEKIEKNTQLALANAMDFKGKWTHGFNIEDTVSEPFHSGNESVEVPMMKTRAEFSYKQLDYMNCQVLQLPYTKGDFDLFVVLPNEDMGLRYVLDNDRLTNLFYQLDDMVLQEVDVSIPRFKIEKIDDLRNNLKENELEEEIDNEYIFGIIEDGDWSKISKIEQLGTINIHEKGTEAAAGTIFTLVPSNASDQDFIPKDDLGIYEMNIISKISNRFAKTLVISKVKNANKSAQEASFTITLPETAFITEFQMEIDGNVHKSSIKGKDEAKTVYTEAVSTGRSAGLVESSSRDSNEFDVSVNLEPESIAVFSLTYEELLQRVHDQYELVLNIKPGEIVENLNIEVNIEESRPLKFVRTPAIRSGKEIRKDGDYLRPTTETKVDRNSAVVKYSPSVKQQKIVACYLGNKVSQGFSGQFVVQYDVEREPQSGEILLHDGYFVHFFAPNDLDPLPTHVVFILDTSPSMEGRKISQLKDAMSSILDELKPKDLISIVEFNDQVIIWDINSETSITIRQIDNFNEPFKQLRTFPVPNPTEVNAETLKKDKNVVQKMETDGYTYIIGGLATGLFLIKQGKEKHAESGVKYQPIIVFLTDGQPNVGISSTDEIVKIVTSLNSKNDKVPIFSLSFGEGADKEFLRKLSTRNMGFSRHIYEASDASLQLQAFYKEISSPLLTDVQFKYTSNVEDLTRTSFPIYFKGGEIVVSGKYSDESLPSSIDCLGSKGSLILKSTLHQPVSSLERLWAYLTVKQLLSDRNVGENNSELLKKATEIALRYSFVTEVTSFVVVKPDSGPMVEEMGIHGDCFLIEELEECIAGEIVLKKGRPKKRVVKKRVIRKNRDDNATEEAIVAVEEENAPEKEDAPKQIPQFIANRPFVVILRMKKGDSNIILLLAQINNISPV